MSQGRDLAVRYPGQIFWWGFIGAEGGLDSEVSFEAHGREIDAFVSNGMWSRPYSVQVFPA